MKTRSESANKAKEGRTAQHRRESRSSPADNDCPREQMIAEAAYFQAERRGFTPGDEMSDWLRAEAEVEALLGSLH